MFATTRAAGPRRIETSSVWPGDGGTTVSLPVVAFASVAAGVGAWVAAGAADVVAGVATGVATAGSVVIEEVVAGACAGDRSLGL